MAALGRYLLQPARGQSRVEILAAYGDSNPLNSLAAPALHSIAGVPGTSVPLWRLAPGVVPNGAFLQDHAWEVLVLFRKRSGGPSVGRTECRLWNDFDTALRLAVTYPLKLPPTPFRANCEVAGGCGINLSFVRVADEN